MALLWCDSFDGMNTAGNGVAEYLRRRYAFFDGVWSAYEGQHGIGQSLGGAYHDLYTPQFSTTDRTFFIGFAFRITEGDGIWLVQLTQLPVNGGSVSTGVGFSWSGGEIRVFLHGSLVWETDTGGCFLFDKWHWVEFKVYCDNTNGVVEIRRGGVTIFSETGDTQYLSGVNYHSGLYFSNAANRNRRIDNLYVCDSTGSKNNTFLGPSRILTLSPSTDGDESDWTPQTGSDHYAMVDEMPLIDEDDYVESTSMNDKDLWGYEDASGIDTIHAVQVITDVQSVDGAASRLKTLTKTGATENADSGLPLKTSYMAIPRTMEVQPAGAGDWSLSALNAYQFGVEHAGV